MMHAQCADRLSAGASMFFRFLRMRSMFAAGVRRAVPDRWIVLLTACTIAALGVPHAPVHAEGILSPPFRGMPGSTYQCWDFNDPAFSLPDCEGWMWNPHGMPTAQGNGIVWLPDFDGRDGIICMPFGSSLSFTVPNQNSVMQKTILVQIIYKPHFLGAPPPDLDVAPPGMIALVNDGPAPGDPNGWRVRIWHVELPVCPPEEVLTISNTSIFQVDIDRVYIDSACGDGFPMPDPIDDKHGDEDTQGGCPPVFFEEREDCGDDTNGGCDSPLNVFKTVFCGDFICGKLYADSGAVDTDWYALDVPDLGGNGESLLSFSVSAEMPVSVRVVSGPCGNQVLFAETFADMAQPSFVSLCVPAPATYYIVVSPGDATGPVTDGFPCDNWYYLALGNCEGCPPCTAVGCADTEGEPCGTDINGGCNSVPPQYSPIACGDVVCGNLWAEAGTRDTDWWSFSLTQESLVTVSFVSEGVSHAAIVTQTCPPTIIVEVIGCDGSMTACLPAGDYALFIALDAFSGAPCPGLQYELMLDCGGPCGGATPCPILDQAAAQTTNLFWATENCTACPPGGYQSIAARFSVPQTVDTGGFSIWCGITTAGLFDDLRLRLTIHELDPAGFPVGEIYSECHVRVVQAVDTGEVVFGVPIHRIDLQLRFPVTLVPGPYAVEIVDDLSSGEQFVIADAPADPVGGIPGILFRTFDPVTGQFNWNEAPSVNAAVVVECGGEFPWCVSDLSPVGGDGCVNSSDLLFLLLEWLETCSRADISGAGGGQDGLVDSSDLLVLLANWGPCPGGVCP